MGTFGTAKSRRVAIITGASSGFGSEFARLFASDGVDVVLVARRTALLKKLANELRKKYDVNVYVYSYDLSKTDNINKLYKAIMRKKLRVYYLVNNAGFGEYGLFDTLLEEKVVSMVSVNVAALTLLTHLFLPQMRRRKCGYILNVASTAAFVSGPFMAEYFATKAYVVSFSEALHQEYASYGVAVTALCPGPSKTGFADNSGIDKLDIFKGNLPLAIDVAKFGYSAMLQNKPIVIFGKKNKNAAILSRLLPRSFVRNQTLKLMQPRK